MPHLIDSNIIIYATQPEHAVLRGFIAEHAPAVSAVSYVEVLGYHALAEAEQQQLETFFGVATVLPLDQAVLDAAVRLRQRRRMSLGDALIAATCLVHNLILVTRNVRDFAWIPELTLLDPFDSDPGGGDAAAVAGPAS
jgi:predicted nucleic acid-binding protein